MSLIRKALKQSPVIIIPDLCYTKSEYARLIGKTPTWVDKLIAGNKLKTVNIHGGCFIISEIPKP